MRAALTLAVLLAVLATALVAVCQHSETRRLQYRVWQLERQRERLERKHQRLTMAIEALRTPRRLLNERDGRSPADLQMQVPAEPSDEKPADASGPPWLLDVPGEGDR